jgi:hypothetical protein
VYDLHGFIEDDRVKFQRRIDDSACFPAFTGVGETAADRRVLGSTDAATCRNRTGGEYGETLRLPACGPAIRVSRSLFGPEVSMGEFALGQPVSRFEDPYSS